ncbi:MAG TPA: 2-oxoglutarate dehydrogenase complex dihydrolipoyllysine-residue succinyltransferase [Gammaproteobacteria bacterium]|nr:2-oxoglutarate dehydrogenase complex dihydrolipoyllysine-residue succinyltransferase [Gammaproteobacteria bacterium]
MSIEIKTPAFPESVLDGTLTTWHKQPGDTINRGEVIADIETDKVVFEVPSLADGIVEELLCHEGDTVLSEQVLARIDTSGKIIEPEKNTNDKQPGPAIEEKLQAQPLLAPSAGKLVMEHHLDTAQITGSGKGGRILKEDVLNLINKETVNTEQGNPETTAVRQEKRVPMTRLRARIAERLLEAQHNAAILTTFNEANMQPVIDLRTRYRDQYEKKHGVRLGFMSFFVKAALEALKQFPEVNASIEGDDIVYHGFFDIGIAVGTPRGLVVPVLRDADQMGMADIEKQISDYGQRAQNSALSLDEITGGTFSITNGGVFGSMLSTPILNPPQSGILGMHKIQPRPVVEENEIVIRPMMYLAFSYDHRIIDGREAVQFLVAIKETIEDPVRLLLDI